MFNDSLYRMSVRRARDDARSTVCTVAELVLEAVHPANLGALPPAPRTLTYKAAQIGLITEREATTLLVTAQY